MELNLRVLGYHFVLYCWWSKFRAAHEYGYSFMQVTTRFGIAGSRGKDFISIDAWNVDNNQSFCRLAVSTLFTLIDEGPLVKCSSYTIPQFLGGKKGKPTARGFCIL